MIKSVHFILLVAAFLLFTVACKKAEVAQGVKAVSLEKFTETDKAKFSEKSSLNELILKKIEEFENNPKSEQAHTSLIIFLLQNRDLELALKVVSSLKALNPNSQQAKVFEKQIKEIDALKGAKVSKKMRKQHFTEMTSAVQEDALARQDESTRKLVDAMGKNTNAVNFMKLAEKTNAQRKEKLLKQYPDICAQKIDYSSKEHRKEMDLQSSIFDTQMKKGSEGLQNDFPKLLNENPKSNIVFESYVRFLLDQKQYDQATSIFNKHVSEITDTHKIKILRNVIERLKSAPSVEGKQEQVRNLHNEWMTLSLVQFDCK